MLIKFNSVKNRSLIGLGIFVLLAYSPCLVAADEIENRSIGDCYYAGQTYFQKKEYAEAAKAFRELVEKSPRFEYFLDLGEAEYMRQRYDLAMEALDVYREGAGDSIGDDSRSLIDKVFEEGAARVGYLDVKEAAALGVWVDGEHRGDTPLSEFIVVMKGSHTIELKNGETAVYKTDVNLEVGETRTIRREETALVKDNNSLSETVAPETETLTASKPPKSLKLRNAGLILAGAGGAMLVVASITGGVALSKATDLERECPDKLDCDEKYRALKTRGEALRTTCDVLWITGGLVAGTGLVLTIIGYRKGKSWERAKIQPFPVINGSMSGIFFKGSF